MASATSWLKSWKPKKQVLNGSSSQSQVQLVDLERPSPPAAELDRSTPDRGEDYTSTLQALFSINMIILFIASTCGIGGTLTAIENLGQIGLALGYPSSTVTTFISLVSIGIYLGQVASGSETFLSKYKFPRRPLMFSLVLLLSCFGHLLIAFGVPNSLFVASVIIGFSFGAQGQLLFAIILEIFSLKYYPTLYNFGPLASPVGMYILNMNVAGRLYKQEALKQMEAKGLKRLAGEDLTCTGVECYKKAFIVITAVTLFGCVVSLVLVIRKWKVREQAEAAEGGNGVVQLREEAFGSTVAGSASTSSDGATVGITYTAAAMPHEFY